MVPVERERSREREIKRSRDQERERERDSAALGAQPAAGVLAQPPDEPEAEDAAAGCGATSTARLDLAGARAGARHGRGGDNIGEEET